MNGAECCALEICCSATVSRKKMADALQSIAPSLSADDAMAITNFLKAKFDLVPAGMAKPLIDWSVKMARMHPEPTIDQALAQADAGTPPAAV